MKDTIFLDISKKTLRFVTIVVFMVVAFFIGFSTGFFVGFLLDASFYKDSQRIEQKNDTSDMKVSYDISGGSYESIKENRTNR